MPKGNSQRPTSPQNRTWPPKPFGGDRAFNGPAEFPGGSAPAPGMGPAFQRETFPGQGTPQGRPFSGDWQPGQANPQQGAQGMPVQTQPMPPMAQGGMPQPNGMPQQFPGPAQFPGPHGLDAYQWPPRPWGVR